MALPRQFLFVDEPAHFRDHEAHVVRLPAGLRSKRKLWAALARTLSLPPYFGRNWDALEECLRDLSWLEAREQVALVHAALPLRAGGAGRQTYLQVLRSAAEFWADQGPPRLVAVFPVATQSEVERLLSA